MRMFAAALGIGALLLAGCGGGEEAGMDEMNEPEAAEMMDEGAMEGEMAPADTTMMDEGMPEEMEEGGGMDDEMGGGQ